jgi:hypothetical protein
MSVCEPKRMCSTGSVTDPERTEGNVGARQGDMQSSSGECPEEVRPNTYVCFSNRPVGVKRFQTIHNCGVDVTRGLVLLYGIGT